MRDIKPHRFNNGFEWKPVPRLGGLATSAQCDLFDRDGYVLIEGALDADEVASVRDEIDRFEEKKNDWLRKRGDKQYDISAADAITFTELIVGKSGILKTPLVDATVDNGCPWILPALHLQGTLKHWWSDVGFRCTEDSTGAVPVEAKVGDIICFSSLTPHRTGPNVTDAIRKAYILQYCAEGTTAFDPRPQNDESRQFTVTSGGSPVVAA